MFYYQNLLGMLTKKMETKSRKIQITKLRVQRKDSWLKSFQNVNWKSGKKIKENSESQKLRYRRKNQKEWLLFVQNLLRIYVFGENGKKINFSLTGGDLIDLSAFTYCR